MNPIDFARFWLKVKLVGSCWVWIAATDSGGYGQFGVKGKLVLVHRFSYELFKGEIPERLTIDHLCRNRLCVNPDHLEVVTLQENIKRGLTGKINHWESRKTHCSKGHELKELNLRKTAFIKYRKRSCRICYNEWLKLYRYNKKNMRLVMA